MTYVMSDLHGRFDRYRAMLERISLSPRDVLYVLGDVLDRGPDGVRILRDMSGRANVLPLLGNHEFSAAMCLPWLMEEVTDRFLETLGADQLGALSDWMSNGGEPTLRQLRALSQEDRTDLLDYLREMELYAEVEAGGRSFLLVHSGPENYAPGKPLEDYALTDFLFARTILDRGEDFFPGRIVISGHTPVRVLREQLGETPSDRILRRGNQIAIDCGCAFEDGRLGCLCLETLEEFYT